MVALGAEQADLIMLPTLNGRIQTRIFALVVFGGIWTLILTPLLPDGAPIGTSYGATFTVLIIITVLGVLWEFVYHGIQQFRWEKDWPTLFGLVTILNEGALVWTLVATGAWFWEVEVSFGIFFFDLLTTWLIVWVMVNGPMRVPFIRWRFHGGELIS